MQKSYPKSRYPTWLSSAEISAVGSILQVFACVSFSSCSLHFSLVRDLSICYKAYISFFDMSWINVHGFVWLDSSFSFFIQSNRSLFPTAFFIEPLIFFSPTVCSWHSGNRDSSSAPAPCDWQGQAPLFPRWNGSSLIAISSSPLWFCWITFQ